MTFRTTTKLLALGLLTSLTLPALAAPALKSEIAVSAAVVTVGDMFTDAGIDAERPLFRAPAPGTAGAVSLEAIRLAAKRAGIVEFEHDAITRVRVERTGVAVDEETLTGLIAAGLTERGVVTGGVTPKIRFDKLIQPMTAAQSDEPVRLADLSYTPDSGFFTARFSLAGIDKPLILRGRLDLMIDAPHLRTTLEDGAIISADDIEMRPVLLQFATSNGLATPDQLIGKTLRRPAREGMLIRASDVTKPELVKRSEMVTLFYRRGPLNLTVRGQALNAATKGEVVAVLNLTSKKVVHGVAADYGAVEVVSDTARLADRQI